MSGAVFAETLRRHWRGMVYWGLSLAFLGFVRIIIVPSVDMLKQVAALMESLPPFMVQAMGGDIAYMATPEGYLSTSFLNFLLIILAIYAVISGLNVTANEEDRGILDVLLGLPLPRWRLVLEKLLAFSLLLIGIIVLMLVGLWLAILMTPALAVDPVRLLGTLVALLPGALAILGFTALSGATMRSRSTAAAVAGGFVAVSYFIDFIGRGAQDSIVNGLRPVSLFAYYDAGEVMRLGINWAHFVVLFGLMVGFTAAAVYAFQRRDIGV